MTPHCHWLASLATLRTLRTTAPCFFAVPTEAREVRGDRGIVVAMLVIMAVRERLAGRPF
jgi:hypothetical protein